MYLGDNILAKGIKEFVDDFKNSSNNACMTLVDIKDRERLKSLGVAEIKDGRIVATEEKPQDPKPNHLAASGIYFFDGNVFKAFNGDGAIKPSARGELEITSGVFRYLIEHDYKVGYYNITGWWKDTGKMDDLIDANRLVLDKFDGFKNEGTISSTSEVEGDLLLGKGSVVEKSQILGPVVIGENVVIKNSRIGAYTAIGNNCVIEDSEIENSILMEGAGLTNLKNVTGSLIGFNAKINKFVSKEIKKNGGGPDVSRIIVGDDSVISLA